VTVDFGVEQGAIPVGGRGRNTNEIGSGSRKKKKKRNEKNVIGGGGNAMGQTISVVQPHTTKFQRLIEKWEPKFEKWDRAIQLMEGQLFKQPPLYRKNGDENNVLGKLCENGKTGGARIDGETGRTRIDGGTNDTNSIPSGGSPEESGSRLLGSADQQSEDCNVDSLRKGREEVVPDQSITVVEARSDLIAPVSQKISVSSKETRSSKNKIIPCSSEMNVLKGKGPAVEVTTDVSLEELTVARTWNKTRPKQVVNREYNSHI
jgi:hypothetical protein